MEDKEFQTKGQREESKEKDAIEKYNIGTLKMYISPEIIETSKSGDFKKRKLSKIYYLRKYTETPSELQQSWKTNGQAKAIEPAAPEQVRAPAPVEAPPVTQPTLNQNLVPKVGGLFSTNNFDSENTPIAGNRQSDSSLYTPNSRNYSNNSIASKPNYDAEPYISSLIKFTTSGFPPNSTVKSRIDTFFNIKLFRSYLKKLGEPMTLFDINNKTKLPSDIDFLNPPSDSKKNISDEKKKVDDGKGNILQIKPQNYEALIGSVYAFLFTKPSEQEIRQQSELSRARTLKPSLLMVKDGDEYSLLGSKIDNKERQISAIGTPILTNTLSKITSDNKINKTIEEAFIKKTGTNFPGTSSDTRRTLLYTPENLEKVPNVDTNVDNLMTIINSGQVDMGKMNSIIQSSRSRTTFGSGDLVLVPIIDIYNVVKGNISESQIEGKFSISPRQKTILKLIIELLQKQNILPTLTTQEKQKDITYDDKSRNDGLKDLSPSSISELNSTIIHNIKFILNVIFSNKTAFMYNGIQYIIDYLDWNNTFKQLKPNAIQKNMKVGYYIEFELFLEKLEKGKLPIDRADTFLGSCTVKKARINSSWKKNFLEQNWGKIVKDFKNAFKPSETGQQSMASAISGLIPNSVKNTLLGSSRELMPHLNAGVNQISFVQYTFIGQDELIKAFKLVDNSYAGVAWKNNQSWEKRKERLFEAMDSCDADVYCFQNVQCSVNVYENILKNLTQQKQDVIKSTDTSQQTLRINIYKNDIQNQLLSDTTDSTNHVAQIYEKYKDYYHFVYFFEQKCIIPSLGSTSGKCTLEADKEFPDTIHPTALGNLTMIKKYKFELKEIFDIRMAPILYSRGWGGILSNDAFKPLWNIDKSFASITYCSFIGKGAPIIASPFGTSPANIGVINKTKLPGTINFIVKDVVDENDTNLKNAERQDYGDKIKENGEAEEGEGEEFEGEDVEGEESEGEINKLGQKGGDGDNQIPKWYEKDDTEDREYGNILGLSGKQDTTQEPIKVEKCEKYFDVRYIPIGQIFGIINVTLDAEKTFNKVKAEKSLSTAVETKNKKNITSITTTSDLTSQLPKEGIEVLLITALIYRFRLRYLLAGSTDYTPVFLSGNFNFGDGMDVNNSLAKKLLELRSGEFKNYKEKISSQLKPYGDTITNFIRDSTILDYLYGGRLRVGRFSSAMIQVPYSILEGIIFPFSRVDGEAFNKKRCNQLIFKTRRLVFCPDDVISGISPIEHNDNFPDFPDNINPSNSNAIGGIFNIETQIVNQHISTVKAENDINKESTGNEDISNIIKGMSDVNEEDEKKGTDIDSDKSEKIIPDVIKDRNDTSYSKKKSFLKSPYPKYVEICESGKTDYKYLTTMPMNQWNNGANQFNVYSDHAPVMFPINTNIDPTTGKHKCIQETMYDNPSNVSKGKVSMTGGGENDIKLISWNIANKCFKTPLYYSHKFVCDSKKTVCEESDEQYSVRLLNISTAIENMMVDNNYEYMLIQEGPFISNDAISKTHITNFVKNIGRSNKLKVVESSIQSAGTTYNSQFYLVTRKDDKDIYENSGLIIFGKSSNKLFSGFAEKLLTKIVSSIRLNNYSSLNIEYDFSKIWFFINQTKRIIFVNVHLPLPQEGSPIKLMSQRQEQIYTFMNAIVSTIRTSEDSKIIKYKDYDIVFGGDFNINMLQQIPSNIIPTFLKCSAVEGQETIIYTNKDNAPSSFGGENKGEYNPTNIDFSIYYPKVTTKVKATIPITAPVSIPEQPQRPVSPPLEPTPAPIQAPVPALPANLPEPSRPVSPVIAPVPLSPALSPRVLPGIPAPSSPGKSQRLVSPTRRSPVVTPTPVSPALSPRVLPGIPAPSSPSKSKRPASPPPSLVPSSRVSPMVAPAPAPSPFVESTPLPTRAPSPALSPIVAPAPAPSPELSPIIAPARAPSPALSPQLTNIVPYEFSSVPIKNKSSYCYQNAAFQLLFSIDSIRNVAKKYVSNGSNIILDNAFEVLKQMDINKLSPSHPNVSKEKNQDILALKLYNETNTQQDSMLFLNSIFDKLISIAQINNDITFWQATYSFCENTTEQMKNYASNLMITDTEPNNFEKSLSNGNNRITPQTRRILMNISPDKYSNIGTLFNINGITPQQIFICENKIDMVNSTIQEIINTQYSTLSTGSNISGVYTGSETCGQIRQKVFIKIPDTLKYICFNKSVLPESNKSYTFQNCKELNINGIKFELRGYISHLGEITFIGSLPSAQSGHYVYVSIENNKQVLYNDSNEPVFIRDDNDEYIRRGYVFLYKRVDSPVETTAKGGTKKYRKRSKYDVNKKTKKNVIRNNKTTNNKNKKKTQHLKNVRSSNNTRKKMRR